MAVEGQEVVECLQLVGAAVVGECLRQLPLSQFSLAELPPSRRCRPCSRQHQRGGTSSRTRRVT